jgi:hypothetical protein
VQRHDGRLGQEPEEQQHERDDHERVGVVAVERRADLRHVQRTGAGVQQCDGDEHRVAAEAVRDREVDRALDRRALLDPVGGERVRDGAHQLEEHDQVEQVAGRAEADHPGHEQQHQPVEEAGDGVEVAQRVDQRGEHEQGCEHRHPRPERVDRQRDTERDAATGPPPAEPVRKRAARGRVNSEQRAQSADPDRGQHAGAVVRRPGRERAGRDQERRSEKRDGNRQGGKVGHPEARSSRPPGGVPVSRAAPVAAPD